MEKVGLGLNRVLTNIEPVKIVQFFNIFKHALTMLILWKQNFRIKQVIQNWENTSSHILKFEQKIFTQLSLENWVRDYLLLSLSLNLIGKFSIKNVYCFVAAFLTEFLLIRQFVPSHLEALSEEFVFSKVSRICRTG